MAKVIDLTQQIIPVDIDQSNRCLLIDADSIAFIVAWGVDKKNFSLDDYMRVVHDTDKFMEDMMLQSGATSYIGFFGGVHPTFRHILDKTYKANRGQTSPAWYEAWASVIKHRLTYKWKFHTIEGIEADDAVGIMAKHIGYGKVIVGHLDKDLDQIPGIHYNYSKQRKYFIKEAAAIRNLYYQMLIGDRIDNLPGCPGIGPVKAENLLAPGDLHSNLALMKASYVQAVLDSFVKVFGSVEGVTKALQCYNLTKVLEDPETNGFRFPVEEYTPVEYTFAQSNTNLFTGVPIENHTQVQNLFE